MSVTADDELFIKRRILTAIAENLSRPAKRATDSESSTSIASVDPDLGSNDYSITSLSTPPRRPMRLNPSFAEEDSGVEWEAALASPVKRDSCSVKRISRSRTRLPGDSENCCDTTGLTALAHATPVTSPFTPPHKRLRSLNLDDSPRTPRSLLKRPALATAVTPVRGVLFESVCKFRPRLLGGQCGSTTRESLRQSQQPLKANINPFTPDNNGRLRRKKQRLSCGEISSVCSAPTARSTPESSFDSGTSSFLLDEQNVSDWTESSADWQAEKLPLKDISNSRYNEEFYEQCKLGDGEHGSVYRCVNKLDGCTYAVKKSKVPVAGSVYERSSLQEVYAHAVLGKHAHVVRYYSAWSEDGYMYIQNEYCNGGNLAEIIAENRKRGCCLTEAELKQLLRHVALGLQYIHGQYLAHMDVKPGNIFVHYNEHLMQSPESGFEEEDSCDMDVAEKVTYKIGDLGHVTAFLQAPVDEGDCRYLPAELLQDRYDHLPKADIFALGLTIYQVGGGDDLPKNGDAWHAIRRGELPQLTRYSQAFNDLIKSMIDPDPAIRPTAAAVANHPVLCPLSSLSRTELYQRLSEEQLKNQLLSRQLKEVRQQNKLSKISGSLSATALLTEPVAGNSSTVTTAAASLPANQKGSRQSSGRSFPRSMSLTAF